MRSVDVTLNLRDNLSIALRSAANAARSQVDGIQRSMDRLRPPSGAGSGGVPGGMLEAGGSALNSALLGVAAGVVAAGFAMVTAFNDAADMNKGQMSATSAGSALLGVSFAESSVLTKDISATLAESANKLPGATKDYLDAFNGVSDTLILGNAMTKKGLTKAGTEMVELTALLGQASGAGSAPTSTALGKMIGDTGSETLFRIDVFEKVPAFKAILEKDMVKSGQTLKDFFKLDSAQKIAKLVGVKQQLFSADYLTALNQSADGQLDTMKSKLFDPVSGVFGFLREINLDGQDTTVFVEIGKLFSALGEFGGAVGKILGGEGFDPMQALGFAIQRITAWFKDGAELINGLPLGDNVFANLQMIGVAIMEDLQYAFSQTDLGLGISTTMEEIGSVFDQIITADLGGMVMLSINDAIAAIVNFGVLIGAGVVNLGMSLSISLTEGAIGLGSSIRDNFLAGWEVIASSISGAFLAAVGAVAAFPGLILTGIQEIGSVLSGALSSFGSALKDAVQTAIGSIPVIGGAAKAVGLAKYSGNNLHMLDSGTFKGTSQQSKIRTAATGNLLDAMETERKMMPSGSSLVIANSSELIVPQSRIPEVLNRNSPQTNSINISITANTVREVLAQVESALIGANRQPGLSMV